VGFAEFALITIGPTLAFCLEVIGSMLALQRLRRLR